MSTALDYSEDYADPKAGVWTSAQAGSPLPKPAGYTGPRSYFDFLQTVKKQGAHGDPSPLLDSEWKIENLDGGGVIDHSHATLQFFRDGRLAGSATCNGMVGSYKSSGSTLTIEPPGTTMMACPEALMNQERKLLDLLPKVTKFHIDSDGALVLSTAGGRTIVARR